MIGSVAIAAATGIAPGIALAQGTSTSAGDQQYVDPLTGTTPAPSTTASSPSAPSSSSPSTSPSTASNSADSTPTTTPSQPTSTTSTSSAGGTLPYTGLNLWPLLALGFALIGGGALLRLALRH